MIVAEESFETSEPSIDNHIVKLKSTNADIFVNISTPKFAAQAIKKMSEIQWKRRTSSTTSRLGRQRESAGATRSRASRYIRMLDEAETL